MRTIYEYLKKLEKNNNREWFNDNKDEYTELKEGFTFAIDHLIYELSQFDSNLKGLQAKDCTFRVHRDIRFSKDKTPYKAHFSAFIAKGGKKSQYPGYYIQIGPNQSTLAAGIWNPDKELRKMIRDEILDNSDDIMDILQDDDIKTTFGTIEGSALKRLPQGYPLDFPYPELLKLQDYLLFKRVDEKFFTSKDWLEQTVEAFEIAFRFQNFFYPIVDDYLESK